MNKEKCLKMLREIKSVSMATVDENGSPQVRIIDVMIVEDEKLYFCTARGKDFYKQLIDTCEVAVVGMNKDYATVRLSGKVEHLENQKEWINRIFDENPVMNDVYPEDSRYILEPFCISTGYLEYFDLGSIPIVREYYTLGEVKKYSKGFLIKDNCIGCGSCSKKCPQKCIKSGVKYEIIQENCLHCGLCFEVCPVKAIERININD